MKKTSIHLLGYIGSIVMIITAFIPGVILISSDYKSADSIAIYSSIIISLMIIMLLSICDMRKITNILILTILNIGIVILPLTLTYFLGKIYGTIFINNIYDSQTYLKYILSQTMEGYEITYYFPAFFLISMSVIQFIIYRIKEI